MSSLLVKPDDFLKSSNGVMPALSLAVVTCEVVQQDAQPHQSVALVCGATPQMGHRSFLRLDSHRDVAT